MKHYIYRHIRLDTNEVFYIGIGTKYNRKFVKESEINIMDINGNMKIQKKRDEYEIRYR